MAYLRVSPSLEIDLDAHETQRSCFLELWYHRCDSSKFAEEFPQGETSELGKCAKLGMVERCNLFRAGPELWPGANLVDAINGKCTVIRFAKDRRKLAAELKARAYFLFPSAVSTTIIRTCLNVCCGSTGFNMCITACLGLPGQSMHEQPHWRLCAR